MGDKISITAIVGSLRRDSFNRQLALAARELMAKSPVPEGSLPVHMELLEYADLPLFNQDDEHPAPPSVTRVRDMIKASGGIWFFTPEYNHYFSGVLKNLIDWLSRPPSETEGQVLAGKKAAVSGISIGMSGTLIAQDHLISVLSFLNMKVMNQPRLAIPQAREQTDPQGKLVLSTSLPFLENQVRAFSDFLRQE